MIQRKFPLFVGMDGPIRAYSDVHHRVSDSHIWNRGLSHAYIATIKLKDPFEILCSIRKYCLIDHLTNAFVGGIVDTSYSYELSRTLNFSSNLR